MNLQLYLYQLFLLSPNKSWLHKGSFIRLSSFSAGSGFQYSLSHKGSLFFFIEMLAQKVVCHVFDFNTTGA